MLLKNYIKLAWRNLLKRKLYSAINIGGLAAGLCICMLIMLYVLHERSYDQFHADSRRIYSLLQKVKVNKDSIQMNSFKFGAGEEMKQQNAAVADYLRMGNSMGGDRLIQSVEHPDVKDQEKNVDLVDANFFRFFSFPLVAGDPGTALQRPYTAVVSASIAKKYFGTTDAVGKHLRYNGQYLFEVTGVMADAPSNSSLKPDVLFSIASAGTMEGLEMFVKNPDVVAGFRLFLKLDDAAHYTMVSNNINRKSSARMDDGRVILVPMADLHRSADFTPGFNLRYLHIFPVVAALILLMALINYMSLSTARAGIRAREIGVRKVMGADRRRIAQQFYVESALYAVLAFSLALLLFFVLRPWFLHMLDLRVDQHFVFSPLMLTAFGLLFLGTVIIAGSYPSFILSRYSPVTVLAGKMSNTTGGATVRRVLTVVQFGAAAVLIICSVVISRQLYFFRHTDTGINNNNVVAIPFQQSMNNRYQAFRQEVASLPGVMQTGTMRHPLYQSFDMFFVSGNDPKAPAVTLATLRMDKDMLALTGLKWKMAPADMNDLDHDDKIVINETAARQLNLLPNPIGKPVALGEKNPEVAGVLKDFHFQSLHSAVRPAAITIAKDNADAWNGQSGGCMYVKIAAHHNIPEILGKINRIYSKYDALAPFKYQFLDEVADKLYTSEDRLASIFSATTGITIAIAALGLLGLAAFSAEQRTREIGVRKVLGASVVQITTLLSKDFIKLVLIALLLATPVAWYLMRHWLEQFAYRITLQPWMFIVAAIVALAAALLSVGLQTMRAAMKNPVITLRVE
ncbi:ABC transporter permease [Chitinophaga vietnamensis]|uniref:ABC transporter permease n=1 Tax=Chitinophaga vietnamensis TaxID=2593957 RepID=UPI00117809A4|nr:ABC transporter permease [Chitinophaga vietnamensis]